MKRKLLAIFILLCMMLSSCGSEDDSTAEPIQSSEQQEEQTTTENRFINIESASDDSIFEKMNSETDEEEPLRSYTVNKIGKLDPDTALDDILPDGYYADNIIWGVSYETVYRACNISSNNINSMNETLFCVQTLDAPYTEWENHVITSEEWVEGESCIPTQVTLTDYGELYVLLEGKEGYYIGKWSPSKGCSAKELDCDYSIFNHEVWCAGDEIGNFFITNDTSSGNMYNYQTLWLDLQFQLRGEAPDKTIGYIWKAVETPISATPYLVGCDANSIDVSADSMRINNTGFSIWAEGQDEPVFTTPHTGMMLEDTVLFYSDTEGYLFNFAGIWEFSIEEQTITNIKGEFILWHDACLRRDDSVLMLSTYYNEETGHQEYYLWEMLVETVYNE